MNAYTKSLSSLALLPFAFKTMEHEKNQCLTAEEEAQELEKILQTQNGGMPADPDEMRDLLAKVRGQKHKKPPQFMRLPMAIKMLTMQRNTDGFNFSCMVPFSQRF